jgi:predicted 3-demethylubiquinone-9 3-methyltransferase (glyoxalase superfamily)
MQGEIIMQLSSPKITACLWYDDQAEDAARLYTSLFPDSRITSIARFPAEGQEIHGKPPGSVMTVAFELGGHPFVALNGGPQFTFDEAISFQIQCDSQEEVDHYWHGLSDGGSEGPCGWLKDRFGLSWQVTPRLLTDIMAGDDADKAARAAKAMFTMSKIDIAAIAQAVA